MRAVVAATLALLLAATVALPHVHTVSTGQECAACVVRSGTVAESQVPSLAPLPLAIGEVVPVLQSLSGEGAPLGAVPGQSPPRA